MDQLQSIHVAVDFSRCSADAFRQAARMAAWNNATLAATHVVDVPAYVTIPEPAFPVGFLLTDELTAEAKFSWENFANDCPGKARASFSIEVGSPRTWILKIVQRDRPDLLVVGAHGAENADRALGPTSSACVQRAATKVLVVRENQSHAFKSVVACIDFSDASRMALEQAIRVAALDDAVLHVLHVYSDPWRGREAPAELKNNMPDFAERYRAAAVERLRDFCRPLAHEMNALKAIFHAESCKSHGDGIVRYIRRQGGDLAVLGTRGTWNLHDAFWGSTAERVVRECPCCVLAVRPPEFQARKAEHSRASAAA